MVMLQANKPAYNHWRDYLSSKKLVVIGVEFRNGAGVLGDHPFPAGLDDCMAGLEWVFSAKKKLDIIALVDEGIYSRCTTTTADGRRNERVCSGTRVRRETVAGGGGSRDEVVTKEAKRGDTVGCQATRRGGGKDGDKDCDGQSGRKPRER